MKLKVRFAFLIYILIFLFSGVAYSEIYKWTDEKGEVHFSDNYSNIPEQYLNQVERKTVKETKEKASPESSAIKEREAKVETPPAPVKTEAKVKEGVSPDDPNAVTVDGEIKQEGKEKMVFYSGSAKNNSNTELNNVEITFTVRGRDGKEENLSLPVKGKKGEGVLESGEVGSFVVQPDTPFPSIAGYGYNFKWKFTTPQQKK